MKGKVALVTGGSRGIGAATARRLAQAGARIVITHRDSAEQAEQVLATLPGKAHRVIQVSASDSPSLRRAADSVRETEGRLDVLVNNAATTKVIPHADLESLDDELFDEIMRTNVRGVFATIRAFRSLLEEGEGGLVVNISSLAARTADGSNVAYSASKAAVDNMTRSLARALSPRIRVLSVAPGLVDTHFTRNWAAAKRQRNVDGTPLGRLATPDEVGDAVLAAATLLRFSTGIVIPVDGGRPLGT